LTGLFALSASAVAGGGLLILDRVANAVVRPVPKAPDVDMATLAVRHEDLVIPSGDHELKGWLLCPADAADRPVVLLAHGWGASYGTLLQLAEPLVAAGYPVLLFDIQGHGRNEAAPYVTVRHFRDDVLAAARFAAERFEGRGLVVAGHSLGGAAAVLAAERGAPLAGVITIAAPADVLEVTAAYLRDKGLPGRFMVVALRPFLWLRVGGTFRHLVPHRKVGLLTQPILVIQPEKDRRVSGSHAHRLAAAAGVEPHVIAGAGHTDVLGNRETHERVLTFLRRVASG
jgi:alpha-beta hydrolase superfamily lysophospholipase